MQDKVNKMSLQRTRPTDALQHIMTSFKHFEKKLDKLHSDVGYHGQTLTELRTMVTHLSTGAVVSPDGRSNDMKRPSRKTTAIQYDDRSPFEEPNGVKPFPSKLKTKTIQGQKVNKLKPNDVSYRTTKLMPSNQKGLVAKRSPRSRKGEAPRKATTLRPQKGTNKKQSKISK